MLRQLRKHMWLWLLVLGAVFTALGAVRGEVMMVLQKAIRICWECVGIG